MPGERPASMDRLLILWCLMHLAEQVDCRSSEYDFQVETGTEIVCWEKQLSFRTAKMGERLERAERSASHDARSVLRHHEHGAVLSLEQAGEMSWCYRIRRSHRILEDRAGVVGRHAHFAQRPNKSQ